MSFKITARKSMKGEDAALHNMGKEEGAIESYPPRYSPDCFGGRGRSESRRLGPPSARSCEEATWLLETRYKRSDAAALWRSS